MTRLLAPITLCIWFLSCVHPVYDGPVPDLAEQQSVWQYLSVYSIYQERLPSAVGNFTPYELFDMINDSLNITFVTPNGYEFVRGRYTEYIEDRQYYGASGAAQNQSYYEGLPIEVTSSTVYMRIGAFDEYSLQDFQDTRAFLTRFDNIVIDLRHNSGGSLYVTDTIVGEFIPENAPYISTRSRIYNHSKRSGETEEWTDQRNARRSPALTDKNLVVITDRHSASASELLTAALKDNGTAKRKVYHIGDTTLGKGMGQVIAPRMGRKTLSVTFIQIRGRSGGKVGEYHKKGIPPDPLPDWLIEERDEECFAQTICDRDLYAAVKLLEPTTTLKVIMDAAYQIRYGGSMQRQSARTEAGAYIMLPPDALGTIDEHDTDR